MGGGSALDEVAERHGLVLVDEGPCAGGEVGARFARTADGRRLVYKVTGDVPPVATLDRLRDAGHPLPRHLPPLRVDGGTFVAQEALDGADRDTVTHRLLDRLLDCNDRQAGHAPPGTESWADFLLRTLTEGADGRCLHEPLRRHSDRTRRLLAWCRDVDVPPLPDDDLVHLDFHHRNVLRDAEDKLVAVVDWEGARGGDRRFDLVTLAFGATLAVCEPGVEARLLAAAMPEPYVAHMALRLVSWAILRHSEDVVEHWLDTADGFRRRLR